MRWAHYKRLEARHQELAAQWALRLLGRILLRNGRRHAGGAQEMIWIYALAAMLAIDGDTVTYQGKTWRLMGFDTPETFNARCEAEYRLGDVARHRLQQLIDAAKDVRIKDSGKLDKYQRGLGQLLLDGKDVGSILIEENLARPYHGQKRQGWCDGPQGK
jgi:endonuclease YncB( thermonuclease family)